MPFKPTFDTVYSDCLRRTLKKMGWECLRADERVDVPESVCRICKNIRESALIIADVTGRNPNVFLEIGLAFGVGKNVVFITQETEDLPFDVRTFHALRYSTDNLPELAARLRDHMENLRVEIQPETKTYFKSRYRDLRKVSGDKERMIEVLVGSTNQTEEWLPTHEEENYAIARSAPHFLRVNRVTPRRGFFEYDGVGYYRVYADGVFHYVGQLLTEEIDGKTTFIIPYLIQQIAALALFSIRVMKRKGKDQQQTIRVDLHGVRGLRAVFGLRFPLVRDYSFSKDYDSVTYHRTFIPSRKWALFSLLCDIYRDICTDLGIINITEGGIKIDVARILKDYVFLRDATTTYRDAGLEAIPSDEILPEKI